VKTPSVKMPRMTEDTNRRPNNTRGRKRDTGRTEAILEAAAALLLEVGFDRFRIQDVAARAGSGTGAIYRRWSTKEALITEAIQNMPVEQAPVTDDPVADLKSMVLPRYISALEKPDLVPGLVAAMRADEGIGQAVKHGYSIEHLRSTIARIIGEDHPHLNILTELSPAIALFRASFTPETIDPQSMIEEYISLVLTVAKSETP